mmetsp:Transcript_95061/g.220675  ORF Transcript_95061/g.220675 Transcript_95061/m.220675 type:complete len:317 (+) Transcript_95061:239-1189(+)
MPFSASAGMHPVLMSGAALTTFPPACIDTTFSSHSAQESSGCLSSGTYARMASCSAPAEKTILPMCPEPPFRSSSPGSDLAFMASTHFTKSSMSPSGSSTDVQKNCRPPMSAAPSISTPRLPPSLMVFLSLALRAASGSSSFFSSLASPFLSFLPPFFSALGSGAALLSAAAELEPAASLTKALAAASATSSFEGSAAWPCARLSLPPPLPSTSARIFSDQLLAETLPSSTLGTAARTANFPPSLLSKHTALSVHFFATTSIAKLRALASSRPPPALTTAMCNSPAAAEASVAMLSPSSLAFFSAALVSAFPDLSC